MRLRVKGKAMKEIKEKNDRQKENEAQSMTVNGVRGPNFP